MNRGVEEYMDMFKDGVEDWGGKLRKSLEKIVMEVIILLMVIGRKINLREMGRYGWDVEERYGKGLGLKKWKRIEWVKVNVWVGKGLFGKEGRWGIGIDGR